jgi:hypothetical protein
VREFLLGAWHWSWWGYLAFSAWASCACGRDAGYRGNSLREQLAWEDGGDVQESGERKAPSPRVFSLMSRASCLICSHEPLCLCFSFLPFWTRLSSFFSHLPLNDPAQYQLKTVCKNFVRKHYKMEMVSPRKASAQLRLFRHACLNLAGCDVCRDNTCLLHGVAMPACHMASWETLSSHFIYCSSVIDLLHLPFNVTLQKKLCLSPKNTGTMWNVAESRNKEVINVWFHKCQFVTIQRDFFLRFPMVKDGENIMNEPLRQDIQQTRFINHTASEPHNNSGAIAPWGWEQTPSRARCN